MTRVCHIGCIPREETRALCLPCAGVSLPHYLPDGTTSNIMALQRRPISVTPCVQDLLWRFPGLQSVDSTVGVGSTTILLIGLDMDPDSCEA